jgi:threonine dehydratase
MMDETPVPLSLTDIATASTRLHGTTLRTPLRLSEDLTRRCGLHAFLKLESLQHTGSFKFRGAMNALMNLSQPARDRGVVTVSTGNHGRALGYAGQRLGVRVRVFMSRLVPSAKVEGVSELGADVQIVGESQDEAELAARAACRSEGMTFIGPFDERDVIAGQGTIGLEIIDDLPDVECVVVPVSGGGLVSGIALAVKGRLPRARIVGVGAANSGAMFHSQAAGEPIDVEEKRSLADSLGGGIGRPNRYTFDIVRKLVDDLILVSENEILDGIRYAFVKERLVVEGAGAVGIAAILARRIDTAGASRLAVVISGANVDPPSFISLCSTEPAAP